MINKLWQKFGAIATFLLLLYIPFATWYWSMKANTQLFKKIFGLIKIKYPCRLKSWTEIIIGSVIIVGASVAFQNLPPKEYDGYLILLSMIGGLFIISAVDKSILTKEDVCNWFNQKRIWCN